MCLESNPKLIPSNIEVKRWTDAAVENQFVEFSKGGPVIVVI